MTRTLSLVAALTLITALPAMAQSAPSSQPATAADSPAPGVNGSAASFAAQHGQLGVKLSKIDRKFITQAALGGKAEVAEAKLAIDKSSRPDVKAFAQKMVDDHGKANIELADLASKDGVTLPDDLSRADRAEVKKLSKLDGVKFERAYIKGQRKAHKMAVALFVRETKSGKNDELKDFASETLPTLRDHQKMAHDMVLTKEDLVQ